MEEELDSQQPVITPDQIKEFEQRLIALCDEFHIALTASLVFPRYNLMPLAVELAKAVIDEHGGVIRTSYTQKEQK